MSLNNFDSKLKYVVKQFLCAVPIQEFDWNDIFDDLTWDNQERLIKKTLNDSKNITYPVKISYQKIFLRFIINKLEKQNAVIHDSVYHEYGRVVSLPESNASICYKHFLTELGPNISIKENSQIISEGTTGLSTWQAGVVLAEWCLQNIDYVQQKTVLELGSGVGLCGLAIALHCKPRKLILTDCHDKVLDTLRENFELNSADKHDSLEIVNLPWQAINNTIASDIDADLILAADVVYDNSLFEYLVNAISILLGCKNHCELILMCTERNDATLKEFLMLLSDSCVIREDTVPESRNFIWSKSSPLKLFRVLSK